MRVTVGMIAGMLAEGHSQRDILKLYPTLKRKLSLKHSRRNGGAHPARLQAQHKKAQRFSGGEWIVHVTSPAGTAYGTLQSGDGI